MISLKNSYLNLPTNLYSFEHPANFPKAELISFNLELASELGISLSERQQLEVFSGQKLGDLNPIALCYSGHQFGHFAGRLGDGRALLLGEAKGNDIQLKGSGTTLYSRRGDGRSPLGPGIREYIVSEAMHALGVPSTRALALVSSGEEVIREDIHPGVVFTRVASSHLRVGTFQYLASEGSVDELRVLADYAIKRHYPDSKDYLDFFKKVCERQAQLVAKWMSLGFIHGVMNTDNTSISGETIDYGPCAFMESFRSDQVFSFIDRHGRYAFNNQPRIITWNMARLADCLVPLIGSTEEDAVKELTKVIEKIPSVFDGYYQNLMKEKLALKEVNREFVKEYLTFLEEKKRDYTNSFHRLAKDDLEISEQWRKLRCTNWKDIMERSNPLVIPRNHLVQKAIDEAYSGNWNYFNDLLRAVTKPFEVPYLTELMDPAKSSEEVKTTFCGT